ncbi:hypothetical protein [Streptomyces sp. NPDC020817]
MSAVPVVDGAERPMGVVSGRPAAQAELRQRYEHGRRSP